MYDDISKISYIKKFTSIYNNEDFRDFFSHCHMREEVIQTFQQKIMLLDKNSLTYEAGEQYYDDKVEEELDAIDSFEKSKKKRKRKLYNIDVKIKNCLDPRKTKINLEFNNRESASIQTNASVKKRHNVKVTTLSMSSKLLMFDRLSLKSFAYELIEIFCFPSQKTKQIFDKYLIEKVEIFHILTDTDSTSLKLIFISDPASTIPESKYRVSYLKL